MRIAILTIGSRGDVFPYITLGKALTRRGHSVRIVTGKGFGDAVRAAGLDYGEIGFDFQELISDPALKAALRSLPALLLAFANAGSMVDVSLRDCWTHARDAQAIIYHPKAMAAPHIAERLDCPAILAPVVPIGAPTKAFESPLLPLRSFGPTMNLLSHRIVQFAATKGFGTRVRTFRSEVLGLASASSVRTNIFQIAGRPVPKVFGFSRHLVPMPPDIPDMMTTGYWFDTTEPYFQPDPDIEAFLAAGEPPIYFGFGSMAGDRPEATAQEIIAALGRIGKRGILARGWGGLKAKDVPSHVYMIDQIPHDWLFPRCAAVVHHGGVGTTHEGLRHGRPTLVRPVFGDQPFWGRRVASASVGPPPIAEKRFESDRLEAALDSLTSQRYREPAALLSQKMAEEPGVDGAAAAIDTMIER